MRDERLRNQSNEPQKIVMTPFQEAIHERLVVSKKMIEDVIDTNDAFKEELDEIEQDLIKSSEKK